MSILEFAADILWWVWFDISSSGKTMGREVTLWFGLILAMEVCAVAFTSPVLMIAGITLPSGIVRFIRWRSQKHAGYGGRFDLRERLFYSALLVVLAACLIDQGAGLLLRHGLRDAVPVGLTAQFAVVAAFPVCLLVLWYLPNRVAAIGTGLILGGVLSDIVDQALFEHMLVYVQVAGGSYNMADATIALGAILLLAGLSLPRAKPERETWSDLRQV